MKTLFRVSNEGWSSGIQSSRAQDYGSFTFPNWGIALLFYKPEKRLSYSIWGKSWSRNYRILGPKKLSFDS